MAPRKQSSGMVTELALISVCIALQAGENEGGYFSPSTDSEEQPHEMALATISEDTPPPSEWTIPPQQSTEETPFRGNWFKKRQLVQEARTLYEELHNQINTTWEPQFQQFEKQFAEVPATLQNRINALGVNPQRIDAARTQLHEPAPVSPQKTGPKAPKNSSSQPPTAVHTPEEVEVIDKKLDELKEAYRLLEEVSGTMAQAIEKTRQQSSEGPAQEKAAWKKYEELDAAYSDQQAAQLFAEMKASQEYIEHLLGYVQRQLIPYCQQLVIQFNQQAERVESLVRDLENQSVFIRPQPPKPEKPAPQKAPPLSWWARIKQWFSALFAWIVSFFKK
jgi:hypothetical protein